ncbi:MAG TPA: MlaD family protein [Candidatus Cloacimonadota bacterium]|nr:MlaD family protein [Candidatus Cloacimonadota bacterium]HPT73031.1 MlaD family protein [Candidatus Cloacimonadota bacterium]
MISRIQKVRLGIFIAVGAVLILIFAAVVAGSQFIKHQDIYYITYRDVSVNGLQEGGAVNYHGIKIGTVKSIRVNPKDVSKIIVEISIQAGTPIKKDVVATLVPVGITGLKSVELKGGSNQAELLPPNSSIPSGVSTFDDITSKAVTIAEKLDMLITNLTVMTGEENQKALNEGLVNLDALVVENRQKMTNILTNLEKISNNTADMTNNGAQKLDRISIKIDSTVTRINQIVNSPEIDTLLANTSKFSGELASSNMKQLILDLSSASKQATTTLGGIDKTMLRGRGDLLQTLENLRELSENLDDFAKQINENPSILIRGRKK